MIVPCYNLHQGRMGFTNRVDVCGRQKMLEAPRGSPQSSSRAQQDGEGDGGGRWRWRRAMAKHSRCAREGARAEVGASEGELSWRGWALWRGHKIYSSLSLSFCFNSLSFCVNSLSLEQGVGEPGGARCHECWCLQTCNVYMDSTIIFYFLFCHDSI